MGPLVRIRLVPPDLQRNEMKNLVHADDVPTGRWKKVPQPLEQWQPIDTAPKDGTNIFVYCGPNNDPMWAVAYWADEVWNVWFEDESDFGTDWPEYWMPLPPPEATATVDDVEFVDGSDKLDRRLPGTYVTLRIDDCDVQWGAGRVAVRYLKSTRSVGESPEG